MSGQAEFAVGAVTGVALGAAADALNDRKLIEAFQDADTSKLSPLDELDERQQMFWVLQIGMEEVGLAAMAPGEISVVLRDVFGIDLSRQKIEATLAGERGTVAKRRRAGRRAYQLMAKGRAELERATDGAIFIDPARGYSGLREVHALLEESSGDLRICDPYVEIRTLDMLAECRNAKSIRVLTRNIKGSDGLKQSLKAFSNEHRVSIHVRRAPGGVLHDRYLIDDRAMLMFGTSLNGLGLKQSFVVALGEDVRAATLAAFEATWDSAEEFWPEPAARR